MRPHPTASTTVHVAPPSGTGSIHPVGRDTLLVNPASFTYEFDDRAVWQRSVSAHDILVAYRARYAPAAGSPVLGAGDPASFGSGNGIGAIGASGAAAASDRFGK